jgi:hypothetical protein
MALKRSHASSSKPSKRPHVRTHLSAIASLWGSSPRGAPDVDAAGYGALDDPSEPTFFYAPGSGSEPLTLYGPHWTDGNVRIANPLVAVGPAASRRAADSAKQGPIRQPYRPDRYRR